MRGSDVACRSGGVVVEVRGARPRAVPVLARYHGLLLAAAAFAGTGLVTGGTRPGPPEHHHPADPLAGRRDRAAPAGDQPAAGDLAGDCAGLLGLATFMHAAGITCSQRLGDLLATLEPAGEARRSGCSGGTRDQRGPLAGLEEIIDASGVAPRIEALLPIGVRHRQLRVRTLLAGHGAGPGRSPARAPDPGPRTR